MNDYREFLLSKRKPIQPAGFEVDPDSLNPKLFPWQRLIVSWACRLGRAAIFAGCGLGKTAMQLCWADQVTAQSPGSMVLLLTPIAVGPQTVAEAAKFGIPNVRLVRQQSECKPGINVTNYQKLLAGRFDPKAFVGVVLDESSILKNYMGKTKQLLLTSFANTPYRLACTATPAPNDHMELGNHSAFLGVMDSDEMLTRWFINDQAHAGHYRLKRHGERDFWHWVASWAVSLDKPSDLGFSDDGFILPPLNMVEHTAAVDATDFANGNLYRSEKLTATKMHKEMRLTKCDRADLVAGLVNASEEPWLVWCNTNYEADELVKRLPGAVEVRGGEHEAIHEDKLNGFSSGKVRVLVSKPSICGFGMNWQHCRNVAFVGLSYSHEQFYQAVRRCWRFGQTQQVNVHIVTAETEGAVLKAIKDKEREYQQMRQATTEVVKEVGLGATKPLQLIEAPSNLARGNCWTMHLGDCVEVSRALPDKSVDFSVFSPPFCSLYIYSEALADMGNSASDEEFMKHLGFLAPELLRITVPGRLCAIHCKDLPLYAGRDEVAGLKEFPDWILACFKHHGWTFHSRVTIWKCPVVERERTNNNGLLHKTVCRDSSQVRQGMADYLLVFRRPPAEGKGLMSDKPIVRPNGLEGFVGDPAHDPRKGRANHPAKNARKKALSNPSIAVWQQYAEPVWWDIDPMDVLNYQLGTSASDEKHICPLQLGLIRRAIHLWSERGDVVFSPFAGIGSEGYVAVQEGRQFVGIELKESYWKRACINLKNAEAVQKTLFDTCEVA